MKSILTTTLAIAMLAGSSFAFAADKGSSGGNKDSATQNMNDDQTNSVTKDTKMTPEEMERCKTAPANDAGCVNAPKQ